MTLSMRRISSLSPLYDRINTTSPRRTDPASPCRAWAGLRKWLGVPVLENEAESFRATWPALPMPLTRTAPGQSRMRRTARSNDSSIDAASARTADASASSTCWANMRREESVIRKPVERFAGVSVWIIRPPALESTQLQLRKVLETPLQLHADDRERDADERRGEYRVELDVYNGPMDLLLYLIKRDELDIYDIPIARITDSYLAYVKMLRDLRDRGGLDINLAGEFLVMAATLMEIKSATLLPKAPAESGHDGHNRS